MPDNTEIPKTFQEWENFLHERVLAARSGYVDASKEHKRLAQIARDLGLLNSDGALAMSQAGDVHKRAYEAYVKALGQLADMSVRRKFPSDASDLEK